MNIGHKNSIRILNRYTSYEIYWYKFVLQSYHLRKVALISYSLSKAASKAAENNGLIGLTSQPPAGSTLAGVWYGQTDDGYHRKQHLLRVVWLTGCSAYAAKTRHTGYSPQTCTTKWLHFPTGPWYHSYIVSCSLLYWKVYESEIDESPRDILSNSSSVFRWSPMLTFSWS